MGGGGQEEITKSPWGPYKDLHKQYASQVGEMQGIPQEYFPGQTVEGRSADTALSYDMLREFTTGNTSANAAGGFFGDVMGGEFMPGADGNPYLDDMFDQQSRKVTEAYQRTVMPTINSRMAGAGRSGSGADANAKRGADQTLARELGGLSTEIYYGDYERRMGDRFRAAEMAPGIDQARMGQIGALRALGQDQESYEQRMIQDAMARHQFAQQEPEARLDRYGQRLGVGSSYGTTTQPGSGGNAGLSAGLGVMSMIGSIGGAALTGGTSLAALGPLIAAIGGMAVGPQQG